jgi:hypothetical protein
MPGRAEPYLAMPYIAWTRFLNITLHCLASPSPAAHRRAIARPAAHRLAIKFYFSNFASNEPNNPFFSILKSPIPTI